MASVNSFSERSGEYTYLIWFFSSVYTSVLNIFLHDYRNRDKPSHAMIAEHKNYHNNNYMISYNYNSDYRLVILSTTWLTLLESRCITVGPVYIIVNDNNHTLS